MSDMNQTGLVVTLNEAAGQVASVTLYGNETLNTKAPCMSELWVNDLPLAFRLHLDPNQPADAHRRSPRLKGERWVDHFSGWGLVLTRVMGERPGLTHRCFGILTLVRRELCDQTLLVPGPGGPPIEAPLYIDTIGVLNWNWRFWGDSTRLIFPSAHSNGPAGVTGHLQGRRRALRYTLRMYFKTPPGPQFLRQDATRMGEKERILFVRFPRYWGRGGLFPSFEIHSKYASRAIRLQK